ncbi:MAG: hypothetical protein RL701_5707 [Pseudomonadota bacterium]|jgi:hypothetical protein
MKKKTAEQAQLEPTSEQDQALSLLEQELEQAELAIATGLRAGLLSTCQTKCKSTASF